MSDKNDELLNLFDASGAVVGACSRKEAKASPGQAAGAVQLLVVGPDGKVLLQKRRDDKENGGLWDKSVGGHVLAGESFDEALIREANEELFGAAEAGRVVMVHDSSDNASPNEIVAKRIRLELNLRDIRFASTPARDLINVTYHAAMYLATTSLSIGAFARQEEELADLRYFDFADIDRMLVRGELAPNMSFLWFALGGRAAELAARGGF